MKGSTTLDQRLSLGIPGKISHPTDCSHYSGDSSFGVILIWFCMGRYVNIDTEGCIVVYLGEDKIELPDGKDIASVRESINEWRHKEVERQYDIKNQDERQILLEGTWRTAWHYVVLCFAILVLFSVLYFFFGLLILSPSGPLLRSLPGMISFLGIWSFFIYCWQTQLKGFAKFSVTIQNGIAEVRAEGTEERITEVGLHTLARAIKEA